MSDIIEVARDLRAIVDMHDQLEDQATHCLDRDLPGGDAMAMLGVVANLEAWGNVLDGAERWNDEHDRPKIDLSHIGDETEWEPPLQTLLFWSEAWRVEHNRESDRRPTIASEARFIGQVLNWAVEHEVHWADFVKDVHQARVRIEDTLMEGYRDGRAATCQCGGGLVRVVSERSQRRKCEGHGPLSICPWPRQGCDDRGGLEDERRCPRCFYVYTVAEYLTHVARDYRDNATALSGDDLEKRTGVRIGTIRMWATRGKIHKRGKDAYGRQLYDVADVERHSCSATIVGIVGLTG